MMRSGRTDMCGKVTSREYKLMLRPDWFLERCQAVDSFLGEIKSLARRSTVKVKVSGDFVVSKKRESRFFDTENFTLRRSGWVLRRRDNRRRPSEHLTLKCRLADRYIAQGVDLAHNQKYEDKEDFEEGITAGFHSRHSRSVTLSETPDKLSRRSAFKDAKGLFEVLGELRHDERSCSPKTKLYVVNGLVAYERVYEGADIQLCGRRATVALIIWTDRWQGRPLVAEFSFRYKCKKHRYCTNVAAAANELFGRIERLDWTAADSPSKTQYVCHERAFCI